MRVRGSVIRSIDEFVKVKHSQKYQEWRSSLPQSASKLYDEASPSDWYPVADGVVTPTELLCRMFYNDPKLGAWESGRFSAEVALSGIYKVFVLISTPGFMLKRASRVIATFYDPTDLQVIDSSDKSMTLECTQLPAKSDLVEYRISGWIEKALEICGCKNLSVQIMKSLARGDNAFTVNIRWD